MRYWPESPASQAYARLYWRAVCSSRPGLATYLALRWVRMGYLPTCAPVYW